MSENGNDQQYGNGNNQWYDSQQYDSQQYGDGNHQQYDSQQYGNGNDQQYDSQQYNGGQYDYNDDPQVRVNLPEGIASHLPESWKNSIEDSLTEAVRKNQNPYEHVDPKQKNAFIRPAFAIIAMLILGAGCFFLKIGMEAFFVLSIGFMCVFIGIGIITDKRNFFTRHTKSCVFLIFGAEVVLASGYQILAGFLPSLQAMNGRTIGMASGIIIGSLGPLLLIFHFVNFYFRKKICTQEVQAVCVYVQSRWSSTDSNGRSSRIYIPIFEFPYKGNTACVAGEGRTNNVPMIGGRYDLMINPNDPTDFYYKKGKPVISVWVLAIIAIAIGRLLFRSTFGTK